MHPPPKSPSSAAPTPGHARSLYLESSPPRSSCCQPLLTVNPTVKLSSSAQEDRLGLLMGLCIARICILFITMCLTRSRCLISICQMSEVTRSLVYFQRLCLLYERGSSKVLSLSPGTSPVLNTLTSMVARNQVRRETLLLPLSLWV